MLRILREHATSWILRGILLLVAVTFISWGGSYLLRERKQAYAAKVNGAIVDTKDYSDAYQGAIKQYREALGPSFSEKMIEELRLKDKVIDDLISKMLIFQEAKRLGLTVQDEELRNSIESIPSFQVNGQFDPRLYERALRLNRMSAADFEHMQRENLLLSKVVTLIRLYGGKVSEDEVLETYLFENERINLTFLKINPETLKGQVGVNEIEIKDYYQKNQEEFRIPNILQIQYLIFRPSDFEGKVQVSSDEIKRFYELRKERFRTPKQVRPRDILIRVAKEDPPNKVEEKRKKTEEILDKARKTKDFAGLAKQVSESNSSSKGGDMGWVQRGTLGDPIETTLFSMKKGDLSGVVRGGDGFYIFKMEDVAEEKEKSLDEVKDQILQALKKGKAQAEASRKADDAFYSLFRSQDLDGFAREKSIPIKTTGLFKEGEEIPEIGRDPAFYSSVVSLKVGEISPVISVSPNFYILKLLNKKESRIPSLEEVKEEARKKIIGVKADEKARQVAEEILKQIRAGKGIKEVAKEQGLPFEETGFFTRTQGVVPKIGPVGEFTSNLASLTEKNPFPKEPLRTKDGYFVVRLSALEHADRNKFSADKKNLERRLTYQKQEEFFQNWLQQLRAKAKIEINKELL